MNAATRDTPRTAARFAVRPIRKSDIAQVQAVEKQVFSTLFPRTSFHRELDNSTMQYWVAERLVAPEDAGVSSSMGEERRASGGVRSVMGRVASAWSALRDDDAGHSDIVGFLGTWYDPDQAHIVSVGVSGSCRRRGVGELLLIAAVEHAIERQSDKITLEVRKSNAAARALYEKYGFVERGIRTAYYSDNREDAVVMTTDPIQAAGFARRFAALKRAHRRRWGSAEADPGPEEGA